MNLTLGLLKIYYLRMEALLFFITDYGLSCNHSNQAKNYLFFIRIRTSLITHKKSNVILYKKKRYSSTNITLLLMKHNASFYKG